MAILNTRLCEKKDESGNWVPFNFLDLRKGDIFRLFDTGQTIVEVGTPNIALGDTYLADKEGTDDKIPTILCDVIEEAVNA